MVVRGTLRGMSRTRRVLALALSTGVTLVAMEGVARTMHQAPWYDVLVAEQSASEALPVAHNSLGLRGPEPGPKAAGTQRVLMLGDSFTYGLGVADDAAVLPALVERALPGVEVVNGGLPGSLTGQWLDLWEEHGDALAPDAVVLVFFLRDGTWSSSIPEYFDRIRSQVVERNQASWAYRNLALFRLYQDRVDRDGIAHDTTQGFLDAYLGGPDDTAEWQRAQDNLRAIRVQAQGQGAQVGLVVYPVLTELDAPEYPFQAIVDHLVDWGHAEGMPTTSLLPVFRGHSAPELWVSPFDQHPNPSGHELAAQGVAPLVQTLLEAEPTP